MWLKAKTFSGGSVVTRTDDRNYFVSNESTRSNDSLMDRQRAPHYRIRPRRHNMSVATFSACIVRFIIITNLYNQFKETLKKADSTLYTTVYKRFVMSRTAARGGRETRYHVNKGGWTVNSAQP